MGLVLLLGILIFIGLTTIYIVRSSIILGFIIFLCLLYGISAVSKAQSGGDNEDEK